MLNVVLIGPLGFVRVVELEIVCISPTLKAVTGCDEKNVVNAETASGRVVGSPASLNPMVRSDERTPLKSNV